MFDLVVHYVLGNIPTWLWPAAAGGSFAIYFFAGVISHLPQISLYAKFIKPVAGIAFIFSVFMYGGAGVVAVYQADLKEAQHKAELAEEKSKDANDKLDDALKANANLIKGHAYGNTKVIYRDRNIINADCKKINPTALDDYNRAIKNSPSFVTTPAPATTGVKK